MPQNQTKPNQTYLIDIYKEDFALNNLLWLICHISKPNHIYLIDMCKADLTLNNLK